MTDDRSKSHEPKPLPLERPAAIPLQSFWPALENSRGREPPPPGDELHRDQLFFSSSAFAASSSSVSLATLSAGVRRRRFVVRRGLTPNSTSSMLSTP